MTSRTFIRVISSALIAAAVVVTLSSCLNRGDEQIVALAAEGRLSEIQTAIASGGNINARAFDDNKTPLVAAALYGHLNVVQFLVESGADLNLKDGGGTPLYWAAFSGHTEIFRYLIAHGAKLNTDEKSLAYLLRVLQEKGFVQLAKLVQTEVEHERK